MAKWDLPQGAPPPAVVPFPAAEARRHQEAWAKFLKVEPEIENKLGMKFRLIPPGEYETSFPLATYQGEGGPAARLRVTAPFYMGTTEVAYAQFEEFVRQTRYQTELERGLVPLLWNPTGAESWRKPGHPMAGDQPVNFVTAADCEAFCAWLGEKDDAVYRLPTEAEWELAARAGGAGPWVYGRSSEELLPHAWLGEKPERGPTQLVARRPTLTGCST